MFLFQMAMIGLMRTFLSIIFSLLKMLMTNWFILATFFKLFTPFRFCFVQNVVAFDLDKATIWLNMRSGIHYNCLNGDGQVGQLHDPIHLAIQPFFDGSTRSSQFS